MSSKEDTPAAGMFCIVLLGVAGLVGLSTIWVSVGAHHRAALTPKLHGGNYMECGQGVQLCGVLALETGYGQNTYYHELPTVHGLWPETQRFGSSRCIRTDHNAATKQVHQCYNQPGHSQHKNLEFQRHEWSKHGVCAGVENADDYFEQVCALAAAPLQRMTDAKKQKGSMNAIVSALHASGLPVWNFNEKTGEIMLSACASSDGKWHLAQIDEFGRKCGGEHPSAQALAPAKTDQRCESGVRGPSCSSDGNCVGVPGCKRCANSGFCTDVASRNAFRSASGNKQCLHGKHGPPCASSNDCDGVSGCSRCARSGFCTDMP